MKLRPMALAVTVLAVTVLTASCDSGDGGSPAPTEVVTENSEAAPATGSTEHSEFCVVLDESVVAMTANSAAASQSDVDQLFLFLANLSETNRMIARLADVAPAEISADMQIVAEAWESQTDAAIEAATNPLGALGGALLSGLLATNSFGAVDAWSVQNCGQPVFSLNLSSVGSQVCAWLPSTGREPFRDLLRPGATMLDARAVLSELADNTAGDGRDAAIELLAAIDEVDPAPRYALEAFGRLAWTPVDAAVLLSTINEELEATCLIPAFDGADLAEVSEMGPRPTNDGATGIARLWRSCSEPELAVENRLVYTCADSRAVVKLDTGVVTWLDDVPERFVYNAGDRLVWFGSVETPAEGLNAPTFTDVLNIAGFDGQRYTVEMESRSTEWTDRMLEIALAWRDRIVTVRNDDYDADTSDASVWDGTGKLIATYTTDNFTYGGHHQITENGVWIDTRDADLVVNAASGELITRPPGFWELNPDVCLDRIAIDNTEKYPIPVLDDGHAISFGSTLPTREPEYLVRPNILVGNDGSRGFAGFDLAGNTIWNLPREVIADLELLGGWLVVENQSGQIIIVDPATGVEATNVSDALASTLHADLAGELDDVMYDRVGGVAGIRTANDYWSLPLAELCPGAPSP